MSTLDLDALEALALAATPGPWVAVRADVKLADGRFVASASFGEKSYADPAFIAAAREAVPALVAEVRRLRSKVAEMTYCANSENGRCAYAGGHE